MNDVVKWIDELRVNEKILQNHPLQLSEQLQYACRYEKNKGKFKNYSWFTFSSTMVDRLKIQLNPSMEI